MKKSKRSYARESYSFEEAWHLWSQLGIKGEFEREAIETAIRPIVEERLTSDWEKLKNRQELQQYLTDRVDRLSTDKRERLLGQVMSANQRYERNCNFDVGSGTLAARKQYKRRRLYLYNLNKSIQNFITTFAKIDPITQDEVKKLIGTQIFDEVHASIVPLLKFRKALEPNLQNVPAGERVHYPARKRWLHDMADIYLEFIDDWLPMAKSSKFLMFLELAQPQTLTSRGSGWGEEGGLNPRQIKRYLARYEYLFKKKNKNVSNATKILLR